MSEPKQMFSASLAKDAVYKTGLRSFMEYRDLGIDRATHGQFRAHVVRIKRDENLFGRFQAGDDHFFAGDESSFGPHVPRQNRLRRDVPAAKVFAQEQTNAGIQRPFV